MAIKTEVIGNEFFRVELTYSGDDSEYEEKRQAERRQALGLPPLEADREHSNFTLSLARWSTRDERTQPVEFKDAYEARKRPWRFPAEINHLLRNHFTESHHIEWIVTATCSRVSFDQIHSRLRTDDGRIRVILDREIREFENASGRELWRFEAGGIVLSDWTGGGDLLLVVQRQDGNTFVLCLTDHGELRWETLVARTSRRDHIWIENPTSAPRPHLGEPRADEVGVVFGSDSVILDRRSGTLKRRYQKQYDDYGNSHAPRLLADHDESIIICPTIPQNQRG